MKPTKTTLGIILLIIVYMVGLFGFLHPDWQPHFEGLTPLNLLFAAGMVFAYHKPWTKAFYLYFVTIFAAGWLVELIGVKTGLIFGEYHYDNGLGFKILDIPLIIGLNWVVLIYCTGTIASYTPLPYWAKALLGATLMVALDALIEPFAIAHGLWTWETPTVPIANYVAWFGISFLMLLPFFKYGFSNHNPLAVTLYILQVVFFGVLCLV